MVERNKKDHDEDQSYIDILKEAQEKIPNVILPSMGLIHNEIAVNIHGKDFFNKKNDILNFLHIHL